MISSLLLLVTPPSVALAATTGMVAGSNCTRSCGEIAIPYPFGVEPGCYHAAGFNLTCNQHEKPPKLFLGDGTVQVLEILVPDSRVRISGTRVGLSFDYGESTTANVTWGGGLPRDGPYLLSESAPNSLVVVGCDIYVELRPGDQDVLLSSCTAVCPVVVVRDSGVINIDGDNRSIVLGRGGNCSGIGCCDTNVALGYSAYQLGVSRYRYTEIERQPPIISAYITDGAFSYSQDMLVVAGKAPEALPAMLDWTISNSTLCPANASAPECRSANSFCRNFTSDVDFQKPFSGYVCSCSQGFQGNPYIDGGCKGTCNS
jgi:hypothetical protein